MNCLQRETSLKGHLLNDALFSGADMQFGSGHNNCRHHWRPRFHSQLEEVLDSTRWHVHVEIDDVSLTLHVDHRSPTRKVGSAQLRLDRLQVRIAAGAIDNGRKACFEPHGMVGGVERKVWNFCSSLDCNAVELTVERAYGMQHACDALDRV